MSKRKTLNDDTLADEWWPREGRRLILAWRPSSRSHVFFGRVFLILQTPGRRLTPCNFHFRRFKSSMRKKKLKIFTTFCLSGVLPLFGSFSHFVASLVSGPLHAIGPFLVDLLVVYFHCSTLRRLQRPVHSSGRSLSTVHFHTLDAHHRSDWTARLHLLFSSLINASDTIVTGTLVSLVFPF